jgi:hypothetical protein
VAEKQTFFPKVSGNPLSSEKCFKKQANRVAFFDEISKDYPLHIILILHHSTPLK